MTVAALASRLALLLVAGVALVSGMAIGLARLGVDLPAAASHAADHGVLMIAAFFATVIGIERAVAHGSGGALLAPAGAAAGGLALLWRLPEPAAQGLFAVGAAVFLAVSVMILRRHVALHSMTLAIAAGALLAGHGVWLAGGSIDAALPWWLAFLVLTIAGERLELTRVLPPAPGARASFGVILAALLVAAAAASLRYPGGAAAFGWALAALALWLLRFDVARRTVRQQGLTRYIATCLLVGYGWLALAGGLGAAGALEPGAPLRDTALHAFTLGFVVSMVFGHAPVIVPALTGARVAYTPLLYLPLAVLHGTVAWRAGGNLLADPAMMRAGAVGNAAAIALFAVTMVTALWRGRASSIRD